MNEGSSDPVALLAIFAALSYDIVAAVNSSPQTTEINAAKRAETLMKWVHIGMIQVALFALIGITIETNRGRPWWPPALGSGLAAGLLYAQYVYAKQSGLNKPGASTENY